MNDCSQVGTVFAVDCAPVCKGFICDCAPVCDGFDNAPANEDESRVNGLTMPGCVFAGGVHSGKRGGCGTGLG